MSDLPWLRLYSDMVDNEKIRLLAFEDRWHFVAILCCKQQGIFENENLIERMLAVKLGVQLRELDEIKRRLKEVNLIDEDFNPIGWDEHQFESDSSKNRTRKYREKQRLNNCNVTETSQERHGYALDTDTDTDTDTDKKILSSSVKNKSFSDDVNIVANHLEKKILSLAPCARPKPKSWLADIDKAIRIDGRTKTELIELIDWIYKTGTFWQDKVLSGKKLRERFDQITMQKTHNNQRYQTAEEKRHERAIERNKAIWSKDFL